MSLRVSFILALGLLLISSSLSAEEQILAEHKIKAAFIFQFSQFSRWAGEEDQTDLPPFKICVAGNDAIYAALKPLESRQPARRAILIRPLTVATAASCHILYLERRGLNNLTRRSVREPRTGLLTVSSESGFARTGGMIELERKDGKIQIHINRQTAAAAGITFSAKLLEVAHLVEQQSVPAGGVQ